MGVGRKQHVAVRLGPRRHQGQQLGEARQHVRASLADEETQVQRHLVVARATGVKEAGDLAQAAGQLGLHRHVHVLLARRNERARRGVTPQTDQAVVDGPRRLGRDDALAREHREVGHRAHQVLAQERPVLLQRAGEGEHLRQERGAPGARRSWRSRASPVQPAVFLELQAEQVDEALCGAVVEPVLPSVGGEELVVDPERARSDPRRGAKP